jgi:hypothetical protein
VPSEQSSGSRIRRGGITRAGNGEARRMLVEAAGATLSAARLVGQDRRCVVADKASAEHCMEGAASSLQSLSQARRRRQEAHGSDHHNRPRTQRLRLGHRSDCEGGNA